MPSRAEATPGFVVLGALPAPGEPLELPADEAHYVGRVCRARAGERLSATDGLGGVAVLELLEVGARVRARVEAIERRERAREAWLVCGCPEGTRADWLVEKLAELGIARLLPVDTARARWPEGAHRQERLERLGLAALRQSRRAWRLKIDPPRPLSRALGALPATADRWLADPRGSRAALSASDGLAIGAVGPAEGFTEAERASLAASGFRSMTLSDGRLRCETAAVAWACWWSAAPAIGPR